MTMKTRPTPEFPIDCTGDVCVGDRIRWTEAVWGRVPRAGRSPMPTKLGERTIEARVVRDSYGVAKQQHTFSLVVEKGMGKDAPKPGDRIQRKGRTIYRNGTRRAAWEDESRRGRALDEKHERGGKAREARDRRRATFNTEQNRRRVAAMLPALQAHFTR